MADNPTIDNGDLTDFVIAADDVGSALHQYVKLEFGGDGTATKVEAAAPLPVTDAGLTTITKAEDAVHGSGDSGVMALGVRKDTAAALAGTDGDYTPLITDSSGRLHVVEPSLTSITKAEDAAHSSGNSGIMALAVRKDTAASLADTDGDYLPLIVDSSGRLHVNIGTAPAAARTADSISSALAVDKLMNNLTAVTPTFAIIDAATSGNNTIVAAAGASNIILVHQVFLVASAAVTVRFESGADGTALTGQMQLAANSGFVLPFSPVGWFKTAANTLLNLELSGAISVDGAVVYSVVT